MTDLDAPPTTDGRIRRPGAGRKSLRERDPELEAALDALIDPDVRGDPESPLRWTCKSTGQLALALTRGGHPVSATTVGLMLKEQCYSLQANVKTKEGAQHPDRDAQFRYLNEQARQFRDAGLPVVSVDCKKKELVGEFKNGGREWQPKGEPVPVNIHDFVTEQGKAIPYGIYDIEWNVGWVNVGQDHETATFAVESLRRWWRGDGVLAYPDADQLLICADGGGSNGYRVRTWKHELWRFALEAGLAITVCHLPPRHQQMEQDRAPALLAHQHELARTPTHQPRSRRRADRGDHFQDWPSRACRTRPRRLPHQPPGVRREHGRHRPAPSRLPRRLELHHGSAPLTVQFVRILSSKALRN
jgi:hypothetical protein